MKKVLALFIIIFSACTPRPKAPTLKSDAGVAVGKIGSTIVTDKQLMERIAAIEKSFPRIYSTHAQKKNLLTEMLNTELLYEAALSAGFDKRFDFKSRMADLYVRDLAEKAKAAITEEEIKKYFEENRVAIEQISARHILLKTNPSMSAKEKQGLREKIEGYRKQALKNPSEFQNLARANSEDSSHESGGELGFFARPQMVGPFSDAAFKLKNIGDISPVIETQFGYHIIQLSGDRRGYETHRELIREQLFRRTQKDQLNKELARLKAGNEFQIYEDNLSKLSPLPKEILTDPADLIPEDGTTHEEENKKAR